MLLTTRPWHSTICDFMFFNIIFSPDGVVPGLLSHPTAIPLSPQTATIPRLPMTNLDDGGRRNQRRSLTTTVPAEEIKGNTRNPARRQKRRKRDVMPPPARAVTLESCPSVFSSFYSICYCSAPTWQSPKCIVGTGPNLSKGDPITDRLQYAYTVHRANTYQKCIPENHVYVFFSFVSDS